MKSETRLLFKTRLSERQVLFQIPPPKQMGDTKYNIVNKTAQIQSSFIHKQ